MSKIVDLLQSKKFGLAFGATLTFIVVWLIFIVPIYSKEVIPDISSWTEGSLQGVWVAEESAPIMLDSKGMQKGIDYVETTLGVEVGELKSGPTPLKSCSSFDMRWAESKPVPCKPGWILVLSDESLLKSSTPGEPNARGRTFLPDEDNDGVPDSPLKWATIVVTDGALDSDDPGETRTLPLDAYANVWTHELLHGLGKGHTFTRIIPGVDWLVQERTGSVLNKNLYDAGWNGAGLPHWDKALLDQYNRKP
jgi:hypothetical protein